MGELMLKIITEQDGKSFEVFVKLLMIEPKKHNYEHYDKLVGFAVAGSVSACRAIHANVYNTQEIVVEDDETGQRTTYSTTSLYRRIEEITNRVCHMFLLPRLAVVEDYQLELIEAEKNDRQKPERYLIAPDGNLERIVGQFLAHTYGLPRTEEWADKYLSLLPAEKKTELQIICTELAGEWANLQCVKIHAMQEQEMLDIVSQAISDGSLKFHETTVKGIATFHEGMTTEEYLRQNVDLIAKNVEEYLKPQYDGTYFDKNIALTNRVSLPAQAKLVMAAHKVLQSQNSCFINADMGCGKTQISLTVAFLMWRLRQVSGAKDGLRVLIMAPSITIPKWANSEIPGVIGRNRAICTVIESTEDALRYVRKVKSGFKVPKGMIEFVLVSTDRMKLGANKYVLAAKWDSRRNVWLCPSCGKPLVSPKAKEDEKDLLATWEDAVEKPANPPSRKDTLEAKEKGMLDVNGLPKLYVQRWSSHIRRFECKCAFRKKGQKEYIPPIQEKGEEVKKKTHYSLVRPALKQRGEDKVKNRWMIAEIFQRKLKKHFHLFIADEIQQLKASDSGRGLAFHKMLKSAKKSLLLTGTLTNGASSSIQSTLWRTDPKALIEDGFTYNTSKELWAAKYGVLERVAYTEDEGITGRTTNRRKDRVVIKEKPGIAPQLASTHLLHKALFLELSEMGLPLVELVEEPYIIELEEEHREAYLKFHRELFDTCKELQRVIGPKVWAQFSPAVLNYADQPHLGQTVVFRDEDGNPIECVEAPAFPEEYETAKEKRLVEKVKQDLMEDRGVIIFNYFTGGYNTNERVQKVLQRHGIASEILDVNTCSPEERFEWLEEQHRRGTKVLIMQMGLVQVGLDLLPWPSIYYYQLHDDINVLRQSSRRSWRIGQHRLCKVGYFVNEGTQQMVQFQRLMSRRINALIVEGRIERSDSLAEYANDDMSSLTFDLSKTLSASVLAEKWKEAAAKDIDQNLEIVSEAEFKERIAAAFTRLTAETKMLCGVSLDDQLIEEVLQSETVQATEQHDLFSFIPQEEPSSIQSIQHDLFSYAEEELGIPLIVEEFKPKSKRKGQVLDSKPIFQLAFNF